MARRYASEVSLEVQASAERVFQALTDWSIRSQWRKGITIQWEGAPQAFAGQKVVFHVKGGLLPYRFAFRVTGVEAPRRLFFVYEDGPLKGRAALEVVPQENGSKVIFHWMKVEPIGVIARFLFAIGWGTATHRVRTLETLRMLKKHLEASNS